MDPVLESVTLEPELEEALANASDAELCDIAVCEVERQLMAWCAISTLTDAGAAFSPGLSPPITLHDVTPLIRQFQGIIK
ncbi:hypothetical protein P7K49_001406 [Saguinus oedipus]|uniref:Uncharacterized protein n=1 Tax=Saguinus oedipus TaxID=9490 RepID=A0ABQ9WED6_SAGOE|nr:hypothetical protein P7K49_001406 [Saguinus oedipus]